MSEEIILKPGDELFSYSRYHGLSRVKVERLTKTTALLNNNSKIRIPFTGHSYAVGDNGYGSTEYLIPTPELIEQYNRQQAIFKISRMGTKEMLKNIPIDRLLKIVELLSL